jgi:hypothetical protein
MGERNSARYCAALLHFVRGESEPRKEFRRPLVGAKRKHGPAALSSRTAPQVGVYSERALVTEGPFAFGWVRS